MTVNLTLVDQGLVIPVHEFNRIFNGDYMRALAAVDRMNQGSEGRAFTGAGRPGHENQSFRDIDQVMKLLGKSQLIYRLDVLGYPPEYCADAVPLQKDIYAESAYSFERVTCIEVMVLFEPF